MLNGPDGVPTVMVPRSSDGGGDGDGGCALEVLGGNDWPHTPLHGGLWLSEEAWSSDGQPKLYAHSESGPQHTPGNVPQVRRVRGVVASLIGLSSSAFYHFVMEVIACPDLPRSAPICRSKARLAVNGPIS